MQCVGGTDVDPGWDPNLGSGYNSQEKIESYKKKQIRSHFFVRVKSQGQPGSTPKKIGSCFFSTGSDPVNLNPDPEPSYFQN